MQTAPVLDAQAGVATEDARTGHAAPVAPSGVVYLPSEEVLLLEVTLPAMTAAQRRAAIGFAIEDQIAQPLDQVQVVLGPELGKPDAAGRYLVAVINKGLLQEHVARLDRRRPARLLPDVLALPRPGPGSWNVWQGGGRILVRQPEGTGFACDPAAMPHFWRAAGQPAVTLFAGTLGDAIPTEQRSDLPPGPDPALSSFDLGAAPGSSAGARLPRGVGAVAAVLLAAAALHLGVLAADVVALGQTAAEHEASLRAALTAAGQSPQADLDQALTAVLAARVPPEPGGFLPLLAQVLAAMAPEAGQVTLQDLSYGAAEDRLILSLEAPDLATLQNVETLLTGAGVVVEAGAAVSGEGAAEVQMTLSDGGGT